jgi:hypothetical protein
MASVGNRVSARIENAQAWTTDSPKSAEIQELQPQKCFSRQAESSYEYYLYMKRMYLLFVPGGLAHKFMYPQLVLSLQTELYSECASFERIYEYFEERVDSLSSPCQDSAIKYAREIEASRDPRGWLTFSPHEHSDPLIQVEIEQRWEMQPLYNEVLRRVPARVEHEPWSMEEAGGSWVQTQSSLSSSWVEQEVMGDGWDLPLDYLG